VAVFYRRAGVVEETDVVAVDVQVHEAAHGTVGVADALLQAGAGALEIVEHGGNGCAVGRNGILAAGVFAKGCRDSYSNRHFSFSCLLMVRRLRRSDARPVSAAALRRACRSPRAAR